MPSIAPPSVMSLLVQLRCRGQITGSGTGFVAISPGGPVLVTNRHNCTGLHQVTGQPLHSQGAIPDELEIFHNRRNVLGQWVSRVEPLNLADGSPRWIEHPTFGPRVDCVALKLTQTDDVQFYPYELTQPDRELAIGPADIVSVIGFPFGLRANGGLAIWATGFVATEPTGDYDNLPLMLIDCRGRPGQSGSPVIAYRSGGMVAMSDDSSSMFAGPIFRFIGIYSGRINVESDLGFVWKRSAIAEIIQTAT